MGRLAQYLPASGQDDTWQFINNVNSFEINNIGDPHAIRYFYVGPENGTEGRRRIDVVLEIHPGSTGSAGILYGLNKSRDVYHMLTLDAQGVVRIFRRDDEGFRPLLEQSSSAFQLGRANMLTIVENGNEISYLLNGTSLGSIGGNLYGFGSVGIAAVGEVHAYFTAFSDGAASDRSSAPAQANDSTTLASNGPASPPNEAIEMRRAQIVDQNGPAGQPFAAYETLVPASWKTQGGVKWSNSDGQAGCFTGAGLIWGTGTQDEAYGLAFMDPLSWGMSTDGPAGYMCLGEDLTDAEMVSRAYFQAIATTLQVTIQDVQRAPELEPLTQLIGQAWRASWPATAKVWVDGVVIRAHVRTQQRENDAYFVVITKHAEANYSGAVYRDGRTAIIMGIFTPVGKLDEGHPGFAPIINNLRVNPQWKHLEQKWWEIKLRQPRPNVSSVAKADTSIGDMMFESWKKREGMKDAGHAKSVSGIWEVQPWKTPSGNTVMLNQNYNHAWQLQNGSIVLTNNANFNPMQAFNQTGQQMRQN
ncbi:hypothetical protein [Leisingera methylohalidivorans]|uniref:Uncharacterized protein n=1 Tax=Leisingera methylohalidivorans DSM 14336 TaxID=999552 RepID=V9VZA3_9RHOB|nr:hypothetical protein [Leisingera methylohalidivorans]AHD03114.1 hypothetical protein METH_12000 [Leisingera methylohalidivorans DSM 14336]